jgi:hypothetical protein
MVGFDHAIRERCPRYYLTVRYVLSAERTRSMTTTANTPSPNLPWPAGAVEVQDWIDPASHREPSRYFEGRNHVVERLGDPRNTEPIQVYVVGTQHADGRIDGEIVVPRVARGRADQEP